MQSHGLSFERTPDGGLTMSSTNLLEGNTVPCHLWHYEGSSTFHQWAAGREFIDYCKTHLPKRDLPIEIGSTGYLNKTADIKPTYCWCLDPVGRFVCVIGDKLVFQRYQKGDVLICGPITRSAFNDCVYEDMLPELIKQMKENGY